MCDYFIKVYKDHVFETETELPELDNNKVNIGDCIHVYGDDVFKWIEIATKEDVPICVFKAECIYDIS